MKRKMKRLKNKDVHHKINGRLGSYLTAIELPENYAYEFVSEADEYFLDVDEYLHYIVRAIR